MRKKQKLEEMNKWEKIDEVGVRCYKYTGCPTRVIFPGLRPGPWKSIIRDPNSIAWLK